METESIPVCLVTCAVVCGSGCLGCIADGPVIIVDAATGGMSLATGSTVNFVK